MFQLERQRGDVSPAGEGGLRRLPSPTCCRGRPPTLFRSLCSPPPPPSLPAGLSSHLRVPQRFRIPLPWPVQPHEQRRLGQQLPQRGVRHQHLQVGPHPPALVPPTRGEKAGGTLQFTVIPAGGASWAPSSGEDAEQSKVPPASLVPAPPGKPGKGRPVFTLAVFPYVLFCFHKCFHMTFMDGPVSLLSFPRSRARGRDGVPLRMRICSRRRTWRRRRCGGGWGREGA